MRVVDTSRNAGYLPWIGMATFAAFYLVWAALHDIIRGDVHTAEYVGLGLGVAALVAVSHGALRLLSAKARAVWFVEAGLLTAFVGITSYTPW